MWWGYNQRRGNALWIAFFIAIGFMLISGRSGSGGGWMIFPLFFFVIPMIARFVSSAYSESEKRKNDAYAAEKPKREPRDPQYVFSQDGEPLEVIEEDVPRRKQKTDDIEYI